ncbi:efflux RND transporter permease subunit [Actinocrispum wychmicini]|uniref:CzcA family heavy metal efflux pump n=1 Tax=Actinocrispum wychmicini TaxID=1213861 RepID=A0A4R2JBW8_9PSEU|nr:efflux RND transporter permease subunit [Actinocrispum wychmicini]TCO54218.1 CzcA family heavy metal efflux pump [Actinocrispum wychmicini]
MTRRRTLMGWIVGSSLKFRYLVVAAAAAMMAVGVIQIRDMRVDVFPEFAPPRVEVQTNCLGLSTADVESLVTVPLEQALNGIPGLDDLRSKSVPQLSSIEMIFQPGTDVLKARQLVAERLSNVTPSLPTWAAPPIMLPPLAATARVMQIGMSSKDHSLISMSMMAYWTIRAKILRVPGVANVAIWGERLQMTTVQVDPGKMQAAGVTLDGVMEATADSVDSGLLKFSSGSVIGTGGAVETSDQRLGIRHVLPILTEADLGRATAQNKDGQPVPLNAVADVKQDHQPLIGDAIINDGPGLLLVVEKLPWGDTLDITRGVTEAVNSMQPGLPGIAFDTNVFRQSNFIETSIDNLTQALVLGFLLVVLILMLFLFEWRVALISLLTIPLSLMAAMLVLHWRGATVNTMTLAGLVLALGAVVDDAIIDVENILRRLREHRREGGKRSTAAVILSASLEVRSPIVYATLIIVAAVIPVFLLEGLIGSFFAPLAVSYTLAIGASMVIALTVTPALCLILLRRTRVERRESPIVRWLQRGYTSLLGRIVNRSRRIYAATAVIILAGLLLVPFLGESLFPHFKERNFLIHWVTTPGTSAAEEARITTQISDELRAIPGVQSFGSHIGQAFLGEEVAGVNFGENWISVAPDVDYDKTLTAIEDVVKAHPGLFHDVQTYLNERIEEVLTGSKEPVVIRIYGQDLPTIRAKAAEVLHKLSGIPGIVDDHTELQVDQPQVQVEVDLAKAAQVGLKPGDVRRAASTLVAGEEVGDIFRDGKAYDVVVWSTPATRDNVQAISELPIDTPSGKPVRLGDVAKVSVQPVPNLIERQADSRRIDVAANVSGRDLGSVTRDVRTALDSVQFPLGYHAEILGEYQARQAAQNRLLEIAIVAGLVILLLLQVSFGNWRLAVLVFLTLPMALVGGVIAAYISGAVISLGSLVGFFTVFGIAARNGILLINHSQHLETVEGVPFGPGLVLRAARERLSPILMTSLATALAVVPLVVLGDRPGHEIEYPLAVVILGGLVTSTLLNLFVVPSLYLRFGRRRRALGGDTDEPST